MPLHVFVVSQETEIVLYSLSTPSMWVYKWFPSLLQKACSEKRPATCLMCLESGGISIPADIHPAVEIKGGIRPSWHNSLGGKSDLRKTNKWCPGPPCWIYILSHIVWQNEVKAEMQILQAKCCSAWSERVHLSWSQVVCSCTDGLTLPLCAMEELGISLALKAMVGLTAANSGAECEACWEAVYIPWKLNRSPNVDLESH